MCICETYGKITKYINGADVRNEQPLHLASEALAGVSAIELLLDSGADIEAKSNLGTPLFHAAIANFTGNVANFKYLLQRGNCGM